MELRLLTAIVLAALLALPLQAAVYQWTDENGQVHYSDRPAHEAATEKQLHLPTGNGSSRQALPEDRKELRQRMLDVYEQERTEKREAAEKRKEERKERKRQCLDARARFDMYENAGSIYDYTGEGDRKYLNKDERKQYIEQLRSDVERYCD